MKTNRILAIVLVIASLICPNRAWGDTIITIGTSTYEFTQNTDGKILISSKADWDALADIVEGGEPCANLSFLMTGNIGSADAPVTKPLGRQVSKEKTDRNRFAGSFDGGDHTLTIALTTTDDWFKFNKGYCAPFAYVKNATIRNLHVAGTVVTSGQWASGLVGSSGNDKSDGSCTINHCRVSVVITNNYIHSSSTFANHGGFIGIAEGNANITDSWFDGKLMGSDYMYSAGFIGLNKGASTLNNCLFHPSEVGAGLDVTGACEFSHDLNGGTSTITTCYYTQSFSDPENAQGKKVYEAIPSGATCTEVTAADGVRYYVVISYPAWEDLQNDMAMTGTITLDKDYTAGTGNSSLVVPAGITVTLNLNGHTIDRGLAIESAQDNGCVIVIEEGASLSIIGNGVITGGYMAGNGGGIQCLGTLIVGNGVSITGNTATGFGGGVYLNNPTGTFAFTGCSVSNNRTTTNNGSSQGGGLYVAGETVTMANCTVNGNRAANAGGGLYVASGTVTVTGGTLNNNYAYAVGCGGGAYLNSGTLTLDGVTVTGNTGDKSAQVEGAGIYVNSGTFSVKGNVQIANNKNVFSKTKQVLKNVFLNETTMISLAGELATGSRLYVTPRTGVFTDGLQGKGSLDNFISDAEGYSIVDCNGEAAFGVLTLTVHEANFQGQTKYWTTFYHPTAGNKLPEGALAFKMKSDHVLYLVGDGSVIPADFAVIIMSNTADDIELTVTTQSVTYTATQGNILKGTNNYTNGTAYVMGKDAEGNMGFFEWSGTSMPANKAYYK